MLSPSITTVLFDIGNTLVLVDYAQIIDAAAEQGVNIDIDALKRAEHFGKRVIDDEIQSGNQQTDKLRWVNYFRAIAQGIEYPPHLVPGFLEKIMDRDKIGFGIWSAKNPEADAVLKDLRGKNYRLGIISNADGRIKGLVNHLGMAPFFSVVLDSAEVGVEKPDPAIFRMALDTLQCPPAAAVYVGDIYSVDALGARAAGITPLIIDPYEQYAVRDCTTIRRLSDLLELLPGTNSRK